MLFTTIILSFLLSVISGAGFEYPPEMEPPKEAHIKVFNGITGDLSFIGEYETPIAIRYASIIDAVNWNCIAVYHTSNLFDAITKTAIPTVVADTTTMNNIADLTQARMLCMAYAMTIVSTSYMPETLDAAKQTITDLGLDPQFINIHQDVKDCGVNDDTCLRAAANTHEFIPEIMASIIAYKALDYLSNDGWNADGSRDTLNTDGSYSMCSANCRPFSDPTKYEPGQNSGPNRWEPLVEDNGKGFFYHYDHVTPHIGTTAVLKTITRSQLNTAANPRYDYVTEKQNVIEALKVLATNDEQKMLVEFFDNKLQVADSLRSALDAELNWSLEERIFWMVGYTASEYDAIIQAWKEKVRWDRIRPTTLIKRDGNTLITTYGGPNQGEQTIASSDFESYIRVMPHSEYPSASGCLCFAAKRYTDLLVNERYDNDNNINTQRDIPITLSFIAGESKIEPGQTPQNDLTVTYNSLTDYGIGCRNSRLWGGMHFTAAVQRSVQLCSYLGGSAKDYVNILLNGHSGPL